MSVNIDLATSLAPGGQWLQNLVNQKVQDLSKFSAANSGEISNDSTMESSELTLAKAVLADIQSSL